MPVNLTRNAIAAINGGDLNLKPLLQVMDIKPIGSGQQRYRLLLSDGVSTQNAMIATQLNDRVKSAQVRKRSVVQLVEYICSTVQSRKIIVVLNMETIIPDCETIGNPQTPAAIADSTVGKVLPSSSLGGSVGTVNVNSGSQCTDNRLQSFRPTFQAPYRPPLDYKNRGPVMRNDAPSRIIPIAALNPYQGRWAIKARVTAKSDIRRYNNAKGDGKVFSFDLLDSDGGEIRLTCFNSVVDRFYPVIEAGKVYTVSKGSLKPAQKNYNHLKNDWEVILDSSSVVDLWEDEDVSIPQQQFTFKSIGEIENAENNSILDVIGVVITVNPSVPIMRKNGMETQRRIINLKDASGWSIELTLWGELCSTEGQKLQELFDAGSCSVLAVKAAKVSEFSGKSVGSISSTQLFINPDIPEAHRLRGWFDQGGKDISAQSVSRGIMPVGSKIQNRKTVSQIKEEGLGRSDRADWVTAKATLTYIKTDNFFYTACPLMVGDRQCNKKVTKSGNGWVCDRCNQEFEECDYRYLLQAQIQDHTGLTWVTAFQESGEEMFGHTAKELYIIKNEGLDDEKFSEIIRGRLFLEFLFRLRIKEETYGEEQRVKITVIKAERVDYSEESRHLLDSGLKYH